MVKRSVTRALARALKGLSLTPADESAKTLAQVYAAAIDEAGVDLLWHLGPRLLEVLVELGMTPKARAAVAKGAPPRDDTAGRSTVDELRARRERRATAVD